MATGEQRSTPVPKVSVGMPAYNSANWIELAITSILDQTCSDLELIISDNASTDATYEISERFARRDSRVRLLRNPVNIGANRNYLAVLDAARAPYFKWATSSDWCAPTFIEKCVAALERDSQAVLACPRTLGFEDSLDAAVPCPIDLDLRSDEPAKRFVEFMGTRGLNNAMNGVIRRADLARATRLGVYMSADIVLMAELALMGKFVLIDEPLFFRRVAVQTATKMKSAQEMERHLVPTARTPLTWQHWRYHLGLLKATRFAGFPSRNWLSAVNYALRSMVWSRQRLAHDMWRSLHASIVKP